MTEDNNPDLKAENADDGIEESWEQFFKRLGKRAVLFHGIAVVVGLIASLGVCYLLVQELTDQLDQRLTETNETLRLYKTDLDAARLETRTDNARLSEVIVEVRERLARIEAHTELSARLMTQAAVIDQQFPTFDDEPSPFLPVGGPEGGIDPDFSRLKKTVYGSMSREWLEAEIVKFKNEYELTLQGGLSGQFDPDVHKIDVTWRFDQDERTGSVNVELSAFVIE